MGLNFNGGKHINPYRMSNTHQGSKTQVVCVIKLCDWFKWWKWYVWNKVWNKVKYITWWHLIRQVQRGGPVKWCDLYESYNWWNSILLATLKNLFVCQWNHLTRPPSRKLCSQILTVSNEMQVHQLSSNEMQFNYVIPHISTLKYHSFTASTNHVNSKAYLTTLPLMQVDCHQKVICFCLYITWTSDECLDYPQTLLQKCINLWFYIPKIYFRNTLMCVRSTLHNVLLPVEWKFLGKRFAFLYVPLLHQFILFSRITHRM